MDQHYYPCIIKIKNGQAKIIAWMFANDYNSGNKLMEHSYITNDFVQTFEGLLIPGGLYYKSRIVWAGDYAKEESNIIIKDEDGILQRTNLCGMFNDNNLIKPLHIDLNEYHYIINHSTKQYIDKRDSKYIHPLPLLTVEGNGITKDYIGSCMELVGLWARDIISIEKEIPEDYVKLEYKFEF